MSHVVKIDVFGTVMQFNKTIECLLRYENTKNFALRLRMNLLQFSGTSIDPFLL